MAEKCPILYFVIPCYNEEKVLPLTAPLFAAKRQALVDVGTVSPESRVMFVDDGSKDTTWELISGFAAEEWAEGVRLSRNRGHQNALLAGLMTAKEVADVTVSLDCDGQDDVNAVDAMLAEYAAGCDVVYGVRKSRDTDTAFKRTTARGFYKLMSALGVESVYDHADYRLMSRRALEGFAQFGEVNLFLRGMVPLVGFKSSSVYYDRAPRTAGESHYPLSKMLALAVNGITSLSVKPLKLIAGFGLIVSLISVIMIVWTLVQRLVGATVSGWSSLMCVVLFLGGVQLLCIGVLGEYIGKIYSEVKHRPRYIIAESTVERGEIIDQRSME